jgi:hypothetical protein
VETIGEGRYEAFVVDRMRQQHRVEAKLKHCCYLNFAPRSRL